MIEHRLIERMVVVIRQRLAVVRERGEIDPLFADAAADFIRTYADRTHHGKEEDILFRELEKRALAPDHRRMMDELKSDHAWGRTMTRGVVEATARYRNGDRNALSDITEHLQALLELYPEHIRKEDKVFFPAARAYFTSDEDQAMLAAFWNFDRAMIHEKYRGVVERLEEMGRSG
jgi:hemerythrin-like domain-containing protein